MKNTQSILKTIAFLMLIFSFSMNGQNITEAQLSQIKELYKPFDNNHTPGGVIVAMRDGNVIYSQAFGMANLAYNIPFKTQTPTNIGSTSKQFTAFAIALLERKGELSIEDDIRKYIPELPDFGDTVRIRHLISHTSGYREYLNSLLMAGRHMSDHISRSEIIPMIQRQGKLQNKPGETFNYNNTGYALLSMVVEKVTGQDFTTWMRENIFLPLGMENTAVRSNPGEVISGYAQGYVVHDKEKIHAVNDIHSSMGAGGIYSTADDLAKWVSNFYKPVLGDTELIEIIQTPFPLNSGESSTYAYGLLVGELNGMKMIQHGGADLAHRSNLMMFSEIKGAIITQSNHSGFPNEIAGKVAGIVFSNKMETEKKDEPEKKGEFVYDAKKFDKLAGRYELEIMPGFVMEFNREEDKIYAQATRQPRFEIFPSSDTTFYFKVVEASMTFHVNEEGIAESLTLHQNGHHKARRITAPAWEPSDAELKMYMGSYYSEELEAIYSVVLDDNGKLILRHRRLEEDIPLKADARDKYSGAFPIMNLEFIRNDEDEVTGFKASSGRSFDIVFEKR